MANIVLNWANVCFGNLVRGIRKTATSYVRGPKSSAQHVVGILAQFGEPCLWSVENKESSPVNEEEIKIKMDDGVDISLTSDGTDLFVDLWEAQPCLWDPE